MKLLSPWFAPAHTLHRVVQVDARRILLQTFLLGLLFSALLITPVGLYQQGETQKMLALRQAEQDRVIQLAAQSVQHHIAAVLSDLRYLSQQNALKAYLENSSREQRRNLAAEYLGLVTQKRVYDQIRFIGLDGREEVRVDYAAGIPRIRSAQDLQDKHERYYFQETQWLAPGQIYVSPFDLNIENGSVEQPIKPTIRFSVPVADSQGLIRGMVVLNYLGQGLFDELDLLVGKTSDIWLLNADGHWLKGPSRQDEWGFIFPQRPHSPPAFWQHAKVEKSGIHQVEGRSIRFERIHPLAVGSSQQRTTEIAQPVDVERYYWTLAVAPALSPPPTAALPPMLWAIYTSLALFAFLAAAGITWATNRNKTLSRVMEKVLDDLPLLVSYVDTEQRYRFNNLAYQRFFGLSPREIFGKTMLELLGEAAYREVQPYIEQALAGKTATFERQLPYAGAGMHDVAVSYLPDFSPTGEVGGFYVLVNDISLIKQSERRERQRMLELAHVSRLASMGEMATEIAHEINQPLAAIAMFSSAGLRSLQNNCDRDQLETWLEAINTQAKRASDIVRRVRHFVQKGQHERAPVNLNQVAEEVVALLRHEARSQQMEFVLQLEKDLPPVQGERVLLEQVVFNLVRNAVEALQLQADQRRITLTTCFDAERVYVEIKDTGPGIDARLGERIFDSFVTSKPDGIGIGLNISRSIIEAHAGKLTFNANPEGGSAFMFSLSRETP